MLLDDDTTFVADECPNGKKQMINSFKSSDSTMSENEIEGTKTTDDPLMNDSLRDSSKITLKITLDHYPTEKMDEQLNNNKSDEVTEAQPVSKPYACYICGKEFSRKSSLKCHVDMHIEGNLFRSRKNGAHIPSEVKDESTTILNGTPAATSNGVADDDGPYGCNRCDRTFPTKRGLYRHSGYHKSQPLSKAEDTGSDIDLTLDDDADETAPMLVLGDFGCSRCGKDFKSAKAMNIHMANVHGKRLTTGEEFDELEVIEMEADESEFVCRYCGKIFHSRRTRTVHYSHVHKRNGALEPHPGENSTEDVDDSFKCPHCNMYFKSRRATSIHVAHRHKSNREDESDETESSSEDEVKVPKFTCNVCGRLFATRQAKSVHVKSEHASRGGKNGDPELRNEPIDCEVCGRKFNSTRAYQAHAEGVCSCAQIVDGSYVYVCQECPKTYLHPNSMSRHRSWHRDNQLNSTNGESTEEEEEEETEDVENEEVNDESEEAEEEESASEDNTESAKKFQCRHCEKCFPNKQAYAGHMKAHNRPNGSHKALGKSLGKPLVRNRPVLVKGEKVYKCPYCPRTFDNCNGYAGHMKSHRGVSFPNAVTVVDSSSERSSTSSSDDDDEVDQVKMFSCRFCNKKFVSPSQLGGHVRNHKASMEGNTRSSFVSCPTVEDKVYKCDACTKTFTYMSELRRHTTSGCRGKRSFHAGKLSDQFKCPYCEQKFLLMCHLEKHLKLRCNVNDLGGESTEDVVPLNCNVDAANGETVDEVVRESADLEPPPTKRIRKSTNMNSVYEYEPIGKTRKSAQTLRKELLDAVSNVEPANGEDTFDEGFMAPDPEFPAAEHFVLTNSNGDQECLVFEQYNDSGYQCNECEESFRDKLQMMAHMSFHFNSGLSNGGRGAIVAAPIQLIAPHKCHFCEELFVNRRYRRSHLCKKHSDEIMQCDVCQKLFLFKATLRRHCKQHLIATRYNCEYCLKSFTSKWFLKRHLTRQCDKKLALEEQNQSAQMAALRMLEHSDESDGSVGLPPRFDESVYSEGVFCLEQTIDLKEDESARTFHVS